MNNPADDMNSIDDIPLGIGTLLRYNRVETNPNFPPDEEISATFLDFFKIKLKVIESPHNFFVNYNSLLGTLTNSRYHHERLRSVKQIVLVNLGELNLFQLAQSCLNTADWFILGYFEYEAGSDYRTTGFYERFPLYNTLKATNSVEICVPRTEHNSSLFLDEAYRYLDALLDLKTKIIVITKTPGVLHGERVLNQRGRYVMSVSHHTLQNQGRIQFLETLMI